MPSDARPDERQEEHEFLQGLKARTGRDLAEWMAAIAAQGFSDKNEIIDWLRNEGLPFARASWLERIHRNGGMPIHAHPPSGVPTDTAPVEAPPKESHQPRPKAARPPDRPSVQPPTGAAAALETLVAAAKGYRPLYLLLEAELGKAIPGVAVTPGNGHASIGAPAEFAAVSFHATELRLGLALGEHPFDGGLQKAKIKGTGAAITHMLVLTDARQVNTDLMALAQAASRRVNG
jgi:Domain of unknown function (DUF5655)